MGVLAGLQLADIPAALVGLGFHAHGDAHLVERPVVGHLVEEEAGEVEGSLYAHASVADPSVVALEDARAGGVVKEHGEVVREAENDASQGVACPTLLSYAVAAAGELAAADVSRVYALSALTVGHEVAMACKVGGVAGMAGDVVLDDALRDEPLGVHLHVGDLAGQQGGLRLLGTAGGTHIDDGVGRDAPEVVGRYVDDDILRG